MAFPYELYTHPSDRTALDALKAIPGFTPLLKGFMNVWNEPQDRILNMSSRIRLGENQLAHVWRQLPPICEKLGIRVPDLYLEMNPLPNAYTSGDNNPYIVITSGLLDNLPEDLIGTVLAHECGHIACHHALYLTMGRVILSGAFGALGLVRFGGLLTVPLQVAFYYWMRCSEFSADRAAVLCDATPRRMQQVCMHLAGMGKAYSAESSMEAFIDQAREYRQMVDSSRWNKTLEFMLLSRATHPLMAVRALECSEWAASSTYLDLITGKLNAISTPALPEEAVPGPAEAPEPPDDKPGRPEGGTDLFGFLKQIPGGLFPQVFGQKEDPPAEPKSPESAEEQLAQYKALLDMGIITRQEYENKKKQLGL